MRSGRYHQRKRTALVKLDTDKFFVLRYIVLQGSKQEKRQHELPKTAYINRQVWTECANREQRHDSKVNSNCKAT